MSNAKKKSDSKSSPKPAPRIARISAADNFKMNHKGKVDLVVIEPDTKEDEKELDELTQQFYKYVERYTGEKAKRTEVQVRYDLLLPEFITAMAEVAHRGAAKHGEDNWKNPGLTGNKSGINHVMKHTFEYLQGIKDDYGSRKIHLAKIAFNAMMEYYHCKE